MSIHTYSSYFLSKNLTGGFCLEYPNYIKISPCFSGRACTLSCSCDQQLRRCADAVFRNWNLRDLQCSLRIFLRIFGSHTWHLDLYFPGTSGADTDDPAQKICSSVPVQTNALPIYINLHNRPEGGVVATLRLHRPFT